MSRATTRALILIPLLLIILVALYFLLRPAPTQGSANTSEPTSTEPEKNFNLAITGGNTMTPKEINVNEGDHVNLNITSNEPLEFHLHGYDLEKEVEPGEPSVLSFDATLTGRFEIENEETQEQLGELLVQPR